MMANLFTGTGVLLRSSLKQNIGFIIPWVLLISMLSSSSILAYRWIFPEEDDRRGLALALTSNPAFELIFGPGRDLLSSDGFNAWRAGQLGALFAALMAILIVIGNSRAAEDSGQAELIASGVVTRTSRLAVPLLLATIAALGLGVVCFLVTWAVGGQVAPTVILSAGFTSIAFTFAGVAAVTAQLGSDARTASTLAIGIMGVTYLARGYLDVSDAAPWTQWLTPFGWLERAGAAIENEPLPLLACLVLGLALIGLAMVLQARRDYAQGLILPPPGTANNCRIGVFSLTWRLHRSTLVTWLTVFLMLGVAFGHLGASVGDILGTNPDLALVLLSGATTTKELSFVFIATIFQLVGIVAAVLGAQVVMRVYAEEIAGRVAPLLSGPLPRSKLFASYVLIALSADALALMLNGAVQGMVAARGSELLFHEVFLQAVATIPAVWLLTGVAVATVGARPKIRAVGWLVIVGSFVLTLLGPTFNLPEWALDLSPLHHVPLVNATNPAWYELWFLTGITAVLVTVGFSGFSHRDIG